MQLVDHARGHHATDEDVFLTIEPRTDPRQCSLRAQVSTTDVETCRARPPERVLEHELLDLVVGALAPVSPFEKRVANHY